MFSFDELIAELKRRPGLYLGGTSIDRLSAFIFGWTYARNSPEDLSTLKGFQQWVADKYGVSNTHRWDSIIQFFCMNDSEVLDRFFDLYDEFKTSTRPVQ
jgi:hypothetical protein